MLTSPAIVDRLKKTGAFLQSPHQQPNHVILNEVRDRRLHIRFRGDFHTDELTVSAWTGNYGATTFVTLICSVAYFTVLTAPRRWPEVFSSGGHNFPRLSCGIQLLPIQARRD